MRNSKVTNNEDSDLSRSSLGSKEDSRLRAMGILKQQSLLLLGGFDGSTRDLASPPAMITTKRQSSSCRKTMMARHDSLINRFPVLQAAALKEIESLAPELLEQLTNNRAALSLSKNVHLVGSFVARITYFGPEKDIKRFLSKKNKTKLSKKLAKAFGASQVQICTRGRETLAKELEAMEDDGEEEAPKAGETLEEAQDRRAALQRNPSSLLLQKKRRASGKKSIEPEEKHLKKLSDQFSDSMYDGLRPSVQNILRVSTKFRLVEGNKNKGVVLRCGYGEDQDEEGNTSVSSSCYYEFPQEGEDSSSGDDAKETKEIADDFSSTTSKDGFGPTLIPLKCMSGSGFFVDNPLIAVLGRYAKEKLCSDEHTAKNDKMPELILGLCVNNWGMYGSHKALIEALLDLLGKSNKKQLSIHTAAYAKDFNTNMLRRLMESADFDIEEGVRLFHADAFEASAKKYGIGFDSIQEDREKTGRLLGHSIPKAVVVEELSNATIQAVKRTRKTDHGKLTKLVLTILQARQSIQDNLKTKGFRRRPVQNEIKQTSLEILELLVSNFGRPWLRTTKRLPGWSSFVNSHGGVAAAILGFFCHSLDVLSGCVGRSDVKITSDLAEKLVTAIVTKENRMMEYTFNQVYELMPVPDKPRMYIYRGLEDLKLFSTMSCGVVDMGGKI